MKYEYIDGELNEIVDKKPFDSPALYSFLKSLGIQKYKVTQDNGRLLIETDAELTTTGITQVKSFLRDYDVTTQKEGVIND